MYALVDNYCKTFRKIILQITFKNFSVFNSDLPAFICKVSSHCASWFKSLFGTDRHTNRRTANSSIMYKIGRFVTPMCDRRK